MIAANLKRRQLTRKEKAKVIEEFIKLYAERSDRWIAEDLGVDKNTIESKRNELEGIGEIHQYPTAQTKDGREYPRKQSKPKATPKPEGKSFRN